MTQSPEAPVVKTICGICGFGCGLNVSVENGRITKLAGMPEHPISKGAICSMPAGFIKWIYHPDRLQYPMKRSGQEFKRISWNEALDTVAAKLSDIKKTYGARGLAFCYGHPLLTQGPAALGFIRRFTDIYGTPNVFSVDSMCWRPFIMSRILTFGKYSNPDLSNSRCIIAWAKDPLHTNISYLKHIQEGMSEGAKLIVVDPRKTSLAKKANIHLQLRPGTDGALLLAMLNTIISEKLYDEQFVKNWTYGFDKLVERVRQYPAEEVEKITWVPAGVIKEAARVYASNRPACILPGLTSIQEQVCGVHNCRSISILEAITGNFDVRGGSVTTPRTRQNPIRLLDMVHEKPLGHEENPLLYEVFGTLIGEGEGQLMRLPDTLLTGEPYPIKAAIVAGSNPMLTWPNSAKVERALKKLDFLVVMDSFMTETAQLADIVLPAASWLEQNSMYEHYRTLFGIPYMMMRKKVVEIGESWPDTKFYLELAKKMGYERYFPWNSFEEAIDYIFEPSGFTVKRLTEEVPEGLMLGPVKYKSYEKTGFRTPSGKVEIYSETLEKVGHDPLPIYQEPPESPLSRPDLAREYPLILITGARKLPHAHSRFQRVPGLRGAAAEPRMEIHPETAAKYHLLDGEAVIVETSKGSIRLKAEVTTEILQGVVSVPHGWAEANVNLLTDETPADPISGFPVIRGILCRVKRAG